MEWFWSGYGITIQRVPELPFKKSHIEQPQHAYDVLRQGFAWLDREVFIAMMLDSRNQVLGIHTVTVGTLNASLVHPREVFRPAILMGANALVLGHNHPSGDPTPSKEDIQLTRRLTEVGELVGIQVLDHLIFTDHKFVSLKETNCI